VCLADPDSGPVSVAWGEAAFAKWILSRNHLEQDEMIEKESRMQFSWKIVPRPCRLIAAVLLAILGVAAGSQAQAFSSTVIQVPGSSFFGGAVSLSADGQTALIGASNEGRAYIFVRDGGAWVEQARLPAAGPSGQGFGRVVALSADGTVALVASPDELACPNSFFPCGAVYIYVHAGGAWTQQDRLTPPYFFDFEFYFGTALALSADGSTVLVGRPGDDCVHQPCRGVVFAYDRQGGTWSLVDSLRASNPSVQIFGVDVSLTPDGSTALIGASLTSCAAGNNCGEAYVFTRSGGTWSEQARLTAPDAAPYASFGNSVGLAADGLTALIGTPRLGLSPGTGPGSVYAFARSGGAWIETQKINGGLSTEEFGHSLELTADGQSALVGAPTTDCAAGADCGAVYRLARSGGVWGPPRALASFPAGALGGYGVALSGDGAVGLAGAPLTACGGVSDCGSVYIFEGLFGALEIPTLGGAGLALLTLALAAGALILLQRRRSL
jgi:hypothetical protein